MKVQVLLIQLYQPDTLILATGSNPFIPPIKGADQNFVVTAHDILLGKKEAGKKIVVIGGGLVGAETAEMSCKVIKVGDANGVKNGYLGIREGFEAGLNA